MPFTLAHPAGALPLQGRLGRFGSVSGLALGSMIPDLVYFLPLGISGSQSHSLPGLFLFCLPAGVVSWFVYRGVLRSFILALVPRSVAHRIGGSRSSPRSLVELKAVCASVVVGAATHVVWDSFTHRTGFVVQAVPALQVPVDLFDWYRPQVFTLLQHSSSLLGLAGIVFWGIRWFSSTRPERQSEAVPLSLWFKSLILAALVLPSCAAGLFVLWLHLSPGESSFRVLQNHLGRAIFSAGTVFLSMLMLSALAWRVWPTVASEYDLPPGKA